jgi:hypothetical protein
MKKKRETATATNKKKIRRSLESPTNEVSSRGSSTTRILDVRIGRETSAPVAQELVSRGIPLVFYTGQAETDLIQAEWPGCKIIYKPAEPRSIVSAVASLLKQ